MGFGITDWYHAMDFLSDSAICFCLIMVSCSYLIGQAIASVVLH